MTQLLYGVALLACPVGMGVMMRGNKQNTTATPPGPADRDELTRLQAEVDQLRATQG